MCLKCNHIRLYPEGSNFICFLVIIIAAGFRSGKICLQSVNIPKISLNTCEIERLIYQIIVSKSN